MENASQALIIAGAILLAILIIAIGMYIYNNAQANITSSLDSMSTSEIEAFNNSFESYKGTQTGAQVSSLAGRMIANASTYQEEPGRVPALTIVSNSWTGAAPSSQNYNNSDDLNDYVNALTAVKNGVQNKHKYEITFGYDGKTGLLNEIKISD